jgi:hypothetical protein
MGQFAQTGHPRAPLDAARSPRAVARGIAYCARHWRGELALLQAFAINGLAVAVLTLSAASALGWSVDTIVEPTAVALGLTAVWAAIALITLWQVVGVVRAADRHARAGRGRLAFGGTLGATLLAVTVAVGVFIRAGLPQIVEASQFALGKDPIGDVAVRVNAEGNGLEIEGPIVFGVTERVRDALRDYPAIATVKLTSPGGRVVEARELRDLLRAHGVTTVAAGNCASACVVAFMAGNSRLLGPRGTLGFHRYRSPGHDNEAEISMSIDRRELTARGVPVWFIDRAYSTPYSEMWRPTVTELAVANIVTGEIDAAGRRRPALDVRAAVEAQLTGSAVFMAVKSVEPAQYEALVDALEQALRRGTPLQDVASRARPLIAPIVARYLPAASDDAIMRATAVSIDALHALQSQSPAACLDFLRPGRPNGGSPALPRELRQRESVALAAIVETGAQGEPAIAGADEQDLQTVVGEVRAQFGDGANVLGRLDLADVDPAVACRVVTALYEGALDLPAPRNAQLLRRLLAGN